jgi:hypothetical protein
MIVQAGPPLSSFLVLDEITGFRFLVPDYIVLLLALLGLFAALFLQPPRS